MPSTWSQLLFHIVFSTKLRQAFITRDLAGTLYPFIGGIVRDEGGTLLACGGMADHIHLLVRWRTDGTIADLLRDVKTRSSRHLRESGLRRFAWQTGYGVFSVSQSQSETVKRYIRSQAQHHAKRDFKSEFLTLLRSHKVEFDEKYVFD